MTRAAAKAPLLLIAAGGTGGHMFPAQALAEEMLSRGWRVTLSTDARGARYAGGFPQAVKRVELRSSTTARGGIQAKLATPVQIGAGIVGALAALTADRPTCVAGFGGYPALPAMSAAWALRVPRLIHEQNGVLGRVNEVFATRVNAVACGTWPTDLPKGVSGHDIGNPVRSAVQALAASSYAPPAADGPLHLLVFGGSQGASIMAQVPKALADLPGDIRARLVVSQQARDADAEAVRAAYADLAIPADIRPFFDDIPDRIARAHLVIARAGASTIADLTVIGRPAILIPYAAATRDHQTANARGMAGAGAAQVLPEASLTAPGLAGHIAAILSDPDAARTAAAASAALGKPDAARDLADLVETLSGKATP